MKSADSSRVNPLTRWGKDLFGAPRYAVLPLTIGYIAGAASVAVVFSNGLGVSWPLALLLGLMLGGIVVLVSPAVWLIVWLTHRALVSRRKAAKRESDLERRLRALEKSTKEAATATADLKYSAEISSGQLDK